MPTPIDITGGPVPLTCWPNTPNDFWSVAWPTLVATLNENFPGIFVGPTAPGPDMQDRIWFNTTNGQWYQFINGTWTQIPIEQQFLSFFLEYYAVDSGVANTIAIAFPARPLDAYGAGLVFWVKVAANNTGATTLNADTVGAVAAKKFTAGGMSDLVQGDLISGGVYVFVHDGNQFVLINPTPAQVQRQVFDDAVTLDTRIQTSPTPSLPCEFTHGFTRGGSPVAPDVSQWVLVCQQADAGFSPQDEVDLSSFWIEEGASNDVEMAFGEYRTSTIVGAVPTWFDAGTSIAFVVNSRDGTEQAITTNRWKLRNRCFVF